MYKELFDNKLFVFEQTVSEFADVYRHELPECNKRYTRSCNMTSSNGSDWYGGLNNLQEAKHLLDRGWSTGAEKAMVLKEKLESDLPRSKTRKRKQVWDNDGESIDVDRALAGNWDYAYRNTRREYAEGVTCITINVGWGGRWDRTSDELFWSGAAALVVSDALEGAGFSVKINATNKGTHYGDAAGGKYSVNVVCLKNHGEPLRVDALAGVIAHSGIFRSYGFRTICNAPFNVGYELGHHADWSTIREVMKQTHCNYFSENDVFIQDCYSEYSAINEVKRVLSKVTGEKNG